MKQPLTPPDISERGFLLDVSRCKVPTMETLFSLVDLLVRLKYNQLYLYVEHTFAYRDHETVWKDASPLTAEEIRALDDYCAERCIELVPVQNSLGHMERWLKHAEYKYLAECPDGFYYEPHKKQYEHGTTLAPARETLDFLDGLYSEYLTNFRSRKFMVGCDEPWELGLGRSKKRVETDGFAAVYADWLCLLDKLAAKHGRHVLYFADMIQSHPEAASQLPVGAAPVIWGYYPGRIPEEDCRRIAAAVPEFYIAPGVNCWLSFTGRLDYAVQNIQEAVALACKYGARGIINTSWGDAGNHYAWSSMYPGLLLGAGLSAEHLADALDQLVFKGASPGIGQALLDLASADHVYQIDGWPAGFPQHLSFRGFFSNSNQLKQFFDGHVPVQDAERTHERFFAARENMAAVCPGNREGEIARQEMLVAADMALLGCERAIRYLKGLDTTADYESVIKEYQAVWLLRARPGGLSESLAPLNCVFR
jgi:hexosaminidase